MPRTIHNEQEAYDLGYANPGIETRQFTWGHLVAINAFRCGQLDYQNHAPRNTAYKLDDYDPYTFERMA
jgi:hypothetical protein